MALTAVSCGDDGGDDTTVPQEVLNAVPGTYAGPVAFDDKQVLSTLTVEVGAATASFNLPWEPIFEYVLSSGSAEAAASVSAQKVSAAYVPKYYNNGVASFLMDTQTVPFTYRNGGVMCKGQLTLTTPSFSYNTKTRHLVFSATISKMALNGGDVNEFKPVHYSMEAAQAAD